MRPNFSEISLTIQCVKNLNVLFISNRTVHRWEKWNQTGCRAEFEPVKYATHGIFNFNYATRGAIDVKILYTSCNNRRFRNNYEIVEEPNSSGENRVRVKFFSLITRNLMF